jgi:murein DD-endopeptidase
MVKLCQIILLCLFTFSMSGQANAIELQFPVACKIMDNCWISNHVDLNDKVGQVSDYKCENKASDNNKSTHISLNSITAAQLNVPVIAAADGMVEFAGNSGGFCGTRVTIEHAKGWKTNYCHLNTDNLSVRTGQNVKAGQILSSIGMTGQTVWPRLSFSVLRNGMVFDPFSGRSTIEGCAPSSEKPLWAGGENPPYEPAAVINAGFTVGYVKNETIINGVAENATAIDAKTPQLSLWSLMMNLRTGDRIEMSIETPNGRVLNEYEQQVEADSDFYPIYFSTRKKGAIWDAGQYRGIIKITRNVRGKDVTSGRILRLNMINRPKYN